MKRVLSLFVVLAMLANLLLPSLALAQEAPPPPAPDMQSLRVCETKDICPPGADCVKNPEKILKGVSLCDNPNKPQIVENRQLAFQKDWKFWTWFTTVAVVVFTGAGLGIAASQGMFDNRVRQGNPASR